MPERGPLFRRGGPDVADDPEALEAAGLCGAENKRKPGGPESGVSDRPAKYRYCHRPKLRGCRRCKRHNGDAPIGPAVAGWGKAPAAAGEARTRPSRCVPGRYSGLFEGSYAEAYQASLQEAEAGKNDLREQIALADVRERRIVELIADRARERQERGESGGLWLQAKALYSAARKASRMDDADAFTRALEELGDLIQCGAGEEQLWREWRENTLVLRRLKDTQQKLAGQAGDYMSRPELRSIAAQLVQLFRDVLPERERLDVAVKRIDAIMTSAAQVAHDMGEVN